MTGCSTLIDCAKIVRLDPFAVIATSPRKVPEACGIATTMSQVAPQYREDFPSVYLQITRR